MIDGQNFEINIQNCFMKKIDFKELVIKSITEKKNKISK